MGPGTPENVHPGKTKFHLSDKILSLFQTKLKSMAMYSMGEEDFRKWCIENYEFYNWSAIERELKIPAKAIYKDLHGYQIFNDWFNVKVFFREQFFSKGGGGYNWSYDRLQSRAIRKK